MSQQKNADTHNKNEPLYTYLYEELVESTELEAVYAMLFRLVEEANIDNTK